ncbi:MAG TPA: hypothetical protein VHM88_05025, partial [Candidatus Acidoferrales bacterium]|nr:hypothetical protein [Candidatus Acidoferrales bacterium]
LFPVGYKSMNTHFHLLESFAQLYEVWEDETLRQRLEELLAIIRDKISVGPGALNLYFTCEWRARSDHDSYGHDVQAAYLMLEAEDALGQGHHLKTGRMAKMLVEIMRCLWKAGGQAERIVGAARRPQYTAADARTVREAGGRLLQSLPAAVAVH